MAVAFIKNKFVSLQEAALPVTDLAVQRGVGLFETLRTYHKIPFTLDERLRRLVRGAKSLGFNLRHSPQEIRAKVLAGLKKIKAREVLIKIILTGGDSHTLLPEGPARLIILFRPLKAWPARFYKTGIKVATTRFSRMLPEFKSLSYLSASYAQRQARNRGFVEAVLRNEKNEVLEGTTFNFAVIKKQQLITPREGILDGVTMNLVLRLARRAGLVVARRPIKYREFPQVDEAFIASATREVIPVVWVDKFKIGTGRPGPYSQKLLAAYRQNAQNSN